MNSTWNGSRDSKRGTASFMVDGMPTITIEMESFADFNSIERLIEREVINRVAKHADQIERLASVLRYGDYL